MQEWSLEKHHRGEKIAFVPTMGSLHQGHLSLLHRGRQIGDQLVLSLFVNPTQFGPQEDFSRYPRDVEGDLKKARECSVDVVFLPNTSSMYGSNHETFLSLEKLPQHLCGLSRPHHFRGVATVVLKLFNIVQPHYALFGEKDFQQLRVIQKMVQDLNVPTEIIPMPIIREKDGLAMSSRNQYLSVEERKAALSLFQSLQKAEEKIVQGCRNHHELLSLVKETLEQKGRIVIDYISLSDPETLEELRTFQLPALLALAVRIGTTRLIDNVLLKKPISHP